jgi:hypothetical protein
MYTEYEEKRGFPIRDFLIKLVLIVVFVLLLIWLLPIPNMKGINNTIFNANVQTMKDAAIDYFTTERLPKNVGDKVTLTLKEMLDMKLLLPFTDKNGDTCDVNKSYVTLEKKETEYLMTIHLKCKGQEDEIVVHLGCYSYCTSAICEKVEEPKKEDPKKEENKVAVVNGPSCSLMVSSGKLGENGWYLSDATVKFKSKTSTNGAKITKYGIGLTNNYDGKDSYVVTGEGVTKVYGYVEDSNGKTAVCSIDVMKDTVAPSCDLTVLSGSTSSNGSYITDVVVGFKTKTDATSGVNTFGLTNSSKVDYNKKINYTINKNGTTKVYGYVKDTAGHAKTCSITVDRNVVSKVSVPSCSLEVTSGTKGANNWYTSNVVVGFKTKSTTNGATITSFGIGTSQTYDNNNTYTINADGTTVLKGYVKDSNGNTATCSITVKKDATKPDCSLAILSGTKNTSGNYTTNVVVGYANKKDATSGLNSFGLAAGNNPIYNGSDKITITNNGTHTIKGYVKDNAGNESTCYVTFTKVALVYEYEYSKLSYTPWSEWKIETYNVAKPPKFECKDNGLTCTEDLGSKYVTSIGKAIYADTLVETTSVSTKTCSGYTYYRDVTNTTKTYAIKVDSGWEYKGMVSLSGVPSDTLSTKYEFVGMDWDRCGNTCTTTPYTVWKKYTRTVSTVTAKDTITTSDGITVKCTSFKETPIKTFNTFSNIVGYEQTRTLVYSYRTKTRTTYTDIKWSSYNDSLLLSQGYKMTGNKRISN